MGIHSWVQHIDLKITHKKAGGMLSDLKEAGLVNEDTKNAKEYLESNYCEIVSDRRFIEIRNIGFDGLCKELYLFLESLEKYVECGSFVKFRSEGDGWAIAIYENKKFVPRGDLLDFKTPEVEIEVSDKWGPMGNDGNTFVYDSSVTEEKLRDFWYWRNGCSKMAWRIIHLGERIGHLKGTNKKTVEDLHYMCIVANQFITGVAALTKSQVNSFKADAPHCSKRLLGVVKNIESRHDESELSLVLRQFDGSKR